MKKTASYVQKHGKKLIPLLDWAEFAADILGDLTREESEVVSHVVR